MESGVRTSEYSSAKGRLGAYGRAGCAQGPVSCLLGKTRAQGRWEEVEGTQLEMGDTGIS